MACPVEGQRGRGSTTPPWLWGARGPAGSQTATLLQPPAPSGYSCSQVQDIGNLKHGQGEFIPTYWPQLEQQLSQAAEVAEVNVSNRTMV